MTAGIRLYFMKAVLPTDFLDSALLDAARTACRRSTTELRTQKDKGPTASVKLPVSEDIILRLRSRCWGGERMGTIGCRPSQDLSGVYMGI